MHSHPNDGAGALGHHLPFAFEDGGVDSLWPPVAPERHPHRAAAGNASPRRVSVADEAQLAALSPMGLFSADPEGRVLQANAQCASLLGVGDASELLGHAWWRVVDEVSLPQMLARWNAAVAQRRAETGVFRARTQPGAPVRWLKVRVVPAGGTGPLAFVGGIVDVSETKRLEEALARKNQLLQAIIEHLPCGLAVFDSDLKHVLSNSTVRSMLDLPDELYRAGDVTLQQLAAYRAKRGDYGDGDVDELVAERVAMVKSRSPHTLETVSPHGRTIQLRGRYMPDGSAVTTYTDITAEREAAAELETSRSRLARVLHASGLGLWEYDCTTNEIVLSDSWSQLLGLPRRDSRMGPAQFNAFIPPQERESVQRAKRQLLKGEVKRVTLEHQVAVPGMEGVWLLTEAHVSQRGSDGRALKILGTCKNITERKKADSALRDALRAADEANRAKSEFLATMSHEIRTPLNGVVGLTEVLSAADLPPMEADSVAMISSCAKSLLSVVDNILDFSKIEAGRLSLEQIPTDVRRLAQELGDVFSVRAAEKGVRFQLSVDPGVPHWVVADPARLRQILLNLLGNALKFTSEGGFSLALSQDGAGDRAQLAFAVRDTGIGISPEDQRLLFTRFTQVDASHTRRYSGSGLGLAICRQLARLMQGDVELQSREGEGSTFTLRLPLRIATPAATAQPLMPLADVRGEAAILIAEDNAVNQLVAQRLLGMLGYRNVSLVSNGREAVAACERTHFDLVLMDCQMPEMDGWQATRHLRAAGHAMPIIALTASAVAGDRERCLLAGMNDYLTKPIESALMAQKLERWLQDVGAEAPEAAAQSAPAAVPAATPAPASATTPAPAPGTAAPAGAPPVFDARAIDDRYFGDMTLFAHCRELFMQQTGESLAQLRVVLAQGDLHKGLQFAHAVKGSAATIGAAALAAVCQRIEHACSEQRPSEDAWLAQADEALAGFLAATQGTPQAVSA